MMLVTLLIPAAIFAAPAADDPAAFEETLARANQAAAEATAGWTRFDPDGKEYAAALDAIQRGGAFDRPVRVAVVDVTFKLNPLSGAMTMVGFYLAPPGDIGRFYTSDEAKRLAAFDAETEIIDKDFKQSLKAELTRREIVIDDNHPQPGDKRQFAVTQLWKWHGRREEAHAEDLKERAKKREQLVAELGRYAEPRRRRLTSLRVEAEVPPTVAAGVDASKLAEVRRADLTLRVESFGLREGDAETKCPVGIGHIRGNATAIAIPAPKPGSDE